MHDVASSANTMIHVMRMAVMVTACRHPGVGKTAGDRASLVLVAELTADGSGRNTTLCTFT